MDTPWVIRGLYWVGWLNLPGAAVLIAALGVFGGAWLSAILALLGVNINV